MTSMTPTRQSGNAIFEVMKQETLQTVVHDLRTPMTVIKGYLHLLLSGMMGEMADEQLELIRRSVAPLEDLILLTENILQASTLEGNSGLKLFETDLDSLLAETIDFYQLPFQQRHMRIFRDGNTVNRMIRVDAFWLRRVLHNLIWNAYKFTPDNGTVMLKVQPDSNGLKILIEDTGRGIPSHKLNDIFKKFEQVSHLKDRKLGTGLGLWICKRVMEMHGGDITVESQEGIGSRFILTIPPDKVIA